MGRMPTGSQTCEGSKRIELSYLLRNGYLQKGKTTLGKLSWTFKGNPAGTIRIICSLAEEKYIRLVYTLVDRVAKKKKDFDYRIYLDSVPSNLGKGEVLYFLCPYTLKRCRILYSAYEYHKWQSRMAYEQRLYYESQLSSKMNYANTRYWKINSQIVEIQTSSHFHEYHQGRLTRKSIRLEVLKAKRTLWNLERFDPSNMPLLIRKKYPS